MINYQNQAKETDVVDIIKFLYSKKWKIATITIIFTLTAAAYVLLATPVYRSEAILTQTTPGSLKSYNLASELSGPALTDLINTGRGATSSKKEQLQPKDVYNIFRTELNSISLKRDFFEKIYFPALSEKNPEEKTDAKTKEIAWKKFLSYLKISTPSPESVSSVALEGHDPEALAPLIMQYVALADERTRVLLADKLQSDVDVLKRSVEIQLQTLRETAETENNAELARLRDAYKVAESINLESPSTSGNLITSYDDNNLYMRGTKALMAEIKIREQRVNYDPYILDLNMLQKKDLLLKSINIDPKKIEAIKIEDEAKNNTTPIKPKKLLSLILALLLGLITSIIIFTIKFFFEKPIKSQQK
ncbi:Wzz/FepE/Etk N-terminal domain-containing protein [Alcaligenes nematophilus]|uniref:Wzz/FepE/Etk N-terminal domain-containing protein n=1 Tax=Alcaligenes nematophilus TaxID=2994643 RepID=UPI0034E0D402